MIGPLDWLRRQRQPKPTEPDPAPHTVPPPRTAPDDTDTTRLFRPGVQPNADGCPCIGIYSRCYCTERRTPTQ